MSARWTEVNNPVTTHDNSLLIDLLLFTFLHKVQSKAFILRLKCILDHLHLFRGEVECCPLSNTVAFRGTVCTLELL